MNYYWLGIVCILLGAGLSGLGGVFMSWNRDIAVSGLKVQMATLQKETAEANQRTEAARADFALANQRTEEIRQQNILLQKAVTPRRIFPRRGIRYGVPPENIKELIAKLRTFENVKVHIQALPDNEPATLALDIEAVLQGAGWAVSSVSTKESGLANSSIPPGIMIEFAAPIVDGQYRIKPEINLLLAALREELDGEQIRELITNIPSAGMAGPVGRLPTDGILILVGSKTLSKTLDSIASPE